jgi:hypothetical protein
MTVETRKRRMNLHYRGLSIRRLWCPQVELSAEMKQEPEDKTGVLPQLLREDMGVCSPATIRMIPKQNAEKRNLLHFVPYRDHVDVVLSIERSPHFSLQFLQYIGILQQ